MGNETHGEHHAHADIPGQIVLVLQGGGALGAYQAGVYQALHDGHVDPEWVIGTSIGAINGAIIAGNPPESRIERLTQFWNGVARRGFDAASWLPGLANWSRDLATSRKACRLSSRRGSRPGRAFRRPWGRSGLRSIRRGRCAKPCRRSSISITSIARRRVSRSARSTFAADACAISPIAMHRWTSIT